MAKIEELEQYKAQQRRLALLALLADQPKATSPCLADEQLAILVEGSLAEDQVDECMAHLAQCDRCSALWVQLDQEWQRQERLEQRNKRRKLQKNPRPFTIIGSLLAAAASIAVFVTITTRVDRKISHPMPRPPAQQQSLTAVPPMPSGEKDAVQKSAPAIAPPQREEPATPAVAANQAPLPASESAKVAENEGAPATLAAAPEPMARMDKPAAAPSPPAVGGVASLSCAAWQEQLRRDCAQPPPPEQMAALATQGRQMLASEALDPEDRQRVTTLLESLERREEVELRCRTILDLLGPVTPTNSP